MSNIATQRFISRFCPRVDVTIKNVTKNNNKQMINKFYNNIKNRNVLQLYHSIRGDNYKESYKSIFKNGFYISNRGNKGFGVYLSSHSNYSHIWAHGDHVIVCNVIVDEKKVNRYHSEIYSSEHNFEYVVEEPDLILPLYLIEFSVKPMKESIKIWTNALCPMCPEYKHKQEEQFRRCDCKQYPIADPDDIISIDKRNTKLCIIM